MTNTSGRVAPTGSDSPNIDTPCPSTQWGAEEISLWSQTRDAAEHTRIHKVSQQSLQTQTNHHTCTRMHIYSTTKHKQMSVHTWDTHRLSEIEYSKECWYFCISIGRIFPYSLKCKVDFHLSSALNPDQNTQCIWGDWRCTLSCPRLDMRSLSNSPHACSLSSLRQQKERRTNISVEAEILHMHMMPGAHSNPLKQGNTEWNVWRALCVCVQSGVCLFIVYCLIHDLNDIFNTCPVMIPCAWWKDMNKHHGLSVHKHNRQKSWRLKHDEQNVD